MAGSLSAHPGRAVAKVAAPGWVYATQWQVGDARANAVDANASSVVTVSQAEDRVQVFTRSGALVSQFSIGAGIDAQGVAIAPDGRILVGDYGGGDVVHVYSAVGAHLGTFAPPGVTNFSPWGIEVDPASVAYAADPVNHTVYRFAPDGAVTTIGSFGAGPGLLAYPYDVAVARDGTVLVADGGNRRIDRFRPDGRYLSSFGSPGRGPGQFSQAPTSVDVMPDGTVVAGQKNGPVQVFAADGTFRQALASEQVGSPITSVAAGPDRSLYIAGLLGNPVSWGVARFVPADATKAVLAGQNIRVVKGRRVKLRIRCVGPAPCGGKVTVEAKGRTVAKGRYRALPGQTVTVKVKLTKRGKALARGHGKVGAKVTITSAGGTTRAKARLRR